MVFTSQAAAWSILWLQTGSQILGTVSLGDLWNNVMSFLEHADFNMLQCVGTQGKSPRDQWIPGRAGCLWYLWLFAQGHGDNTDPMQIQSSDPVQDLMIKQPENPLQHMPRSDFIRSMQNHRKLVKQPRLACLEKGYPTGPLKASASTTCFISRLEGWSICNIETETIRLRWLCPHHQDWAFASVSIGFIWLYARLKVLFSQVCHIRLYHCSLLEVAGTLQGPLFSLSHTPAGQDRFVQCTVHWNHTEQYSLNVIYRGLLDFLVYTVI